MKQNKNLNQSITCLIRTKTGRASGRSREAGERESSGTQAGGPAPCPQMLAGRLASWAVRLTVTYGFRPHHQQTLHRGVCPPSAHLSQPCRGSAALDHSASPVALPARSQVSQVREGQASLLLGDVDPAPAELEEGAGGAHRSSPDLTGKVGKGCV